MLARARISARRASTPVTAGVRPCRTASVNSMSSAVREEYDTRTAAQPLAVAR
jgi:hypothetical protein